MATKKRKPSAAFMKPMTPSAALGEVIGNKALPRTQVTKKIWEYIKRRGLQDSKNRRMINADDETRQQALEIVRDSIYGAPAAGAPCLCSSRP